MQGWWTRNNKLETLLESDASNAQSWIAEGCDDNENDDEMENNMLLPKKGSRSAQVEIREPGGKWFCIGWHGRWVGWRCRYWIGVQ